MQFIGFDPLESDFTPQMKITKLTEIKCQDSDLEGWGGGGTSEEREWEAWTGVHRLKQAQFSESLAWLELACAQRRRRCLNKDTGGRVCKVLILEWVISALLLNTAYLFIRFFTVERLDTLAQVVFLSRGVVQWLMAGAPRGGGDSWGGMLDDRLKKGPAWLQLRGRPDWGRIGRPGGGLVLENEGALTENFQDADENRDQDCRDCGDRFSKRDNVAFTKASPSCVSCAAN